MKAIKTIAFFFLIALAGAAFTYFDFFATSHVSSNITIFYGPGMVLIGIGGIFLQIYLLIYNVWHRGDTSALDSANNIMGPAQVSEEQKLIREKKSD